MGTANLKAGLSRPAMANLVERILEKFLGGP